MLITRRYSVESMIKGGGADRHGRGYIGDRHGEGIFLLLVEDVSSNDQHFGAGAARYTWTLLSSHWAPRLTRTENHISLASGFIPHSAFRLGSHH